MQRRSAIGRLATTLAGLSLGEVPSLGAAGLSRREFTVTRSNLAESSGLVTCPVCHELADSLALTVAGPCLRCADIQPELRAEFQSRPFWVLSPEETKRLEVEIEQLAARLNQMNARLAELRERQIDGGGDSFDRAAESERSSWHAMQRELHLLHLLRAASRQFGA